MKRDGWEGQCEPRQGVTGQRGYSWIFIASSLLPFSFRYLFPTVTFAIQWIFSASSFLKSFSWCPSLDIWTSSSLPNGLYLIPNPQALHRLFLLRSSICSCRNMTIQMTLRFQRTWNQCILDRKCFRPFLFLWPLCASLGCSPSNRGSWREKMIVKLCSGSKLRLLFHPHLDWITGLQEKMEWRLVGREMDQLQHHNSRTSLRKEKESFCGWKNLRREKAKMKWRRREAMIRSNWEMWSFIRFEIPFLISFLAHFFILFVVFPHFFPFFILRIYTHSLIHSSEPSVYISSPSKVLIMMLSILLLNTFHVFHSNVL